MNIALLAAVTVIILTKKKHYISKAGLVLVLVGGLHNLYQRVVYNCVVDNINFFDLFMFNLSDLSISSGVVLILIDLLKDGKKNTDN